MESWTLVCSIINESLVPRRVPTHSRGSLNVCEKSDLNR